MLEHRIAALITGGARILTGAQCRWVGCEPSETQRIYFANHSSHLDFVLLWSALPPSLRAHTRPVAAADYWDRGTLRRYLIHRVFKGVLIERSPLSHRTNPIQSLVDALDRGDSLIVFPEGTRGTGDELLEFKSGIHYLAQMRPAVELVPVWLDNNYRVMPKGSFFPVPLLCSVTFGSPTHLGANENKPEFLARLRRLLTELGGA
jgi:1-acyl-sn-glycerol-3-phosphate acyltransferase